MTFPTLTPSETLALAQFALDGATADPSALLIAATKLGARDLEHAVRIWRGEDFEDALAAEATRRARKEAA